MMNDVFLSLNGGEVSPLLTCRLDMERRRSWARELTNFVVLEQGGVAKRPGLEMVACLPAGSGYARVVPHEARVTAPAVLWLTDGACFTVRHGEAFDAAKVTETGMTGEEAMRVVYTQVNDVLFCAHPSRPVFTMKLAPEAEKVTKENLTYTQHPWETMIQQDWKVFYDKVNEGYALTCLDKEIFKTGYVGDAFRITAHRAALTHRCAPGVADYAAYTEVTADTVFDGSEKLGTVYYALREENEKEYAHLYTLRKNFIGAALAGLENEAYFLQGEILWDPDYVTGDWSIQTTGTWAASYALMRSYDSRKDAGDWREWDWHAVKSFEQYGDMAQFQTTTVTGGGEKSTSETVVRPNYMLTGSETQPCHLTMFRTRALKEDVEKPTGTLVFTVNAGDIDYSLKVVSVEDAHHATAVLDVQHLAGPPAGATKYWAFGAFGAKNGFPAAIAFHENRLYLAGCHGKPQTIYASKVDDYGSFYVSSLDDSGLSLTIVSRNRNAIEWMCSGQGLLIGTGANEWRLTGQSGSGKGAVTPTSYYIELQSSVGSSGVAPLQATNSTLFIGRGGSCLYESAYSYEVGSYKASNLSVFAEHLARDHGGVQEMAYQLLPYAVVWLVCKDGTLLSCSYNAAQGVIAWARHETGRPGLRWRSVCVTHDPADGEATGYDMVWFTAADEAGVYLLKMHWRPVARVCEDRFGAEVYPIRARLTTLPIEFYGGPSQCSLAAPKRQWRLAVRVAEGSALQAYAALAALPDEVDPELAARYAVSFDGVKGDQGWVFAHPEVGQQLETTLTLVHAAAEPCVLLALNIGWNTREN